MEPSKNIYYAKGKQWVLDGGSSERVSKFLLAEALARTKQREHDDHDVKNKSKK